VTVRVTPSEHARLSAEAAQLGTSLAGLAERYITKGSITFDRAAPATLHPAVLAELKRIASALDVVANAPPGHLPEKASEAATAMRDLIRLLVKDQLLSQHVQASKNRTIANDSAPASPRHEFQRVGHVRAARSGESQDQ
jgi:hypothetical protein